MRIFTFICVVCGNESVGRHNQKTCSINCRRTHKTNLDRVGPTQRTYICDICEISFEHSGRGIPKTCSDICYKERERLYHQNYVKNHREEYRNNQRRWYWNTLKPSEEKWKKYLAYQRTINAKVFRDRDARIPPVEGEACYICKKIRPLFPDHDHKCHERSEQMCDKCYRGRLCTSCNNGLGLFKDSPELLITAALYLEAHSLRTMEEYHEKV